ncbi:hypothetical protein ACT2E5_04645 [Burkholderia vietnamiensis]|uniref:hypothetical protein n=1 Tax=Burkholderia vietnamiensis TaxID=60552 RepID=UPI0018C73B0D
MELELQQARYEATLAEQRYAACAPENRLIAAQLEKNLEAALRRVHACQARLETVAAPEAQLPCLILRSSPRIFVLRGMHQVTMRTRQRLFAR